MEVYPTHDGFIGRILSAGQAAESKQATIIVLDCSGSMAAHLKHLSQQVLPAVLSDLGYKCNDPISVVTFNSHSKVHTLKVQDLHTHSFEVYGVTNMAPAVEHVDKLIDKLPDGTVIRILSISDGELHDIDVTVTEATKLMSKINRRNLVVDSQAVRFMNGYEPDTRGLSSMLQLSTATTPQLIDIKPNQLAIPGLFEERRSVNKLHCLEEVLMASPWRPASRSIDFAGDLVWLKSVPKELVLNGVTITPTVHPVLYDDVYLELMNYHLKYYLQRLKVLRVVNSSVSQKEISSVVSYFTGLEKHVTHREDGDIDFKLVSRLKLVRKHIASRSKSLVMAMAQIANDEKVAKLNHAQQADYLRQVDNRSLASRAVKGGLDFDAVVRQELKQMALHLPKLKTECKIECKASFYSTGTTLEGIEAACELASSPDVTVDDVLKLINIVGIPCAAKVGDLVDPMCYRVDELFYGSSFSVSDMLMAHSVSGKAVKAVGTKKDIVNVIPVFEDQRIHLFLKKHAPSLLEYSASIGMRRVCAMVPMTHSYTIAAGLWRCAQDLCSKRSTVALETFKALLETYQCAIGRYFDPVHELCVKQQDETLGLFIDNNGLMNMLRPITRLVEEGKTHNMARILRAVYSFEVCQSVRRLKPESLKSEPLKAQETLQQLLGIDLAKTATPVAPLFEPEAKDPAFCDSYQIDNKLLDSVCRRFKHLDLFALFPQLLTLSAADPTVTLSAADPTATDEKSVCSALGLEDVDLRTFKFYSVVQALLFPAKKDRVGDGVMLITELHTRELGERLVRDYVRRVHEDKYKSDLALKHKQEHEQLIARLVETFLETEDLEVAHDLLRNGLTQNHVTHKISNTSSLGYADLRRGLLERKVPLRTDKARAMLLAHDPKGEVLWNNGNTLTMNIVEFERVFRSEGVSWNDFIADLKKYRNVHSYRTKPNRHTHSNGKPSYWAMGYATLDEMVKSVTDDEWQAYKKIHSGCCGM